MPSEAFLAEFDAFTPSDLQALLLRSGRLFPMDGLRSARDLAAKTFAAAIPPDAVTEETPLLLQAGEFLKSVGEPPPFVVQRILPEKSLVLLSGKPKAGKSLAAIDLMDSVCQGKDVWGTFATNRKGPVVYFGMEDGKYEIANRLLARGIKPGDDRPFYVCYHRFNLSRPEAFAAMRALIESIGVVPVLVVIDTAREALGIVDWSNAGEIVEKIRPLRDEFVRKVCSVLLVCHNRKAIAEDAGDEIAGSNAFTGAVDGYISAHKADKSKDLHRLHIRTDGRGGMRDEFILDMNLTSLSWRVLTEEEMADAQRVAQREARREKYLAFIDALEQCKGKATVNQMADLAGEEYRNARIVVAEMAEKGYLRATGEKYQGAGAGRPAPLYVVGEGISELRNYNGNQKGSTAAEIINPSHTAPMSDWDSSFAGTDNVGQGLCVACNRARAEIPSDAPSHCRRCFFDQER